MFTLPIHLEETLRMRAVETEVEAHDIADDVSFVR